jgi:hypothetical protein
MLPALSPSALLGHQPPAVSAPDRPGVLLRLAMLAAVFAIPAFVTLRLGVDHDAWWHLRAGQWIIDNGTVPQTDPFSTVGPDHPWVAYSWLYEVLLAGLFRIFGVLAFPLSALVPSLAVTWAVWRLVSRREPRFVRAAMLTGLAALALAMLFKQRPWLFSFLFATLTLDVILDLRSGRPNRLTGWLPLVYVLWANLHIQFVYGLALLGLACAAPCIDFWLGLPRDENRPLSPRWRQTVRLTACCFLATLLTPYHLRLWGEVLRVAGQTGTLRFISEMRALDFREPGHWVMVGLAGAAMFALGRRQHVGSFEVLLMAAAAYCSFRSQRDLWFLVVASTAVLASGAPAEVHEDERLVLTPRRRLALAGMLAALILFAGWLNRLSPGRIEAEAAGVFPVEAADFVSRQGYNGPLFNDFNWGGYLSWALPGLQVAIDGRANLHGDVRIERIGAVWAGAASWRDDPDLDAAGVIIAPAEAPLTTLLLSDPRFERVHTDRLAVVFVAGRNLNRWAR